MAARSKPPADAHVGSAVAGVNVVVAIRSAEFHPVSIQASDTGIGHRIDRVSAESGQTQPILTGLVTDGERRVFHRLPLTADTLDLQSITRAAGMTRSRERERERENFIRN